MQANKLAAILLRTPLAEVQLVDGSTNKDRSIKGVVTNGNEVYIYPMDEKPRVKLMARIKVAAHRFASPFLPL